MSVISDAEFARLLEAHYLSGLSFARRITFSIEDARDALQDASVRAWANRSSYRGDGFSTWFRRVIRNGYIDNLRRRKNSPLHFSEPEDMNIVYNDPFEQRVADRITLDKVYQELEDQGALELFVHLFVDGHTYDQGAELLGVNTPTVRSRVHRVRQKLLQKLGREV